jgi:hypothetical protein
MGAANRIVKRQLLPEDPANAILVAGWKRRMQVVDDGLLIDDFQ